jgi:hypothetical protein
MHSDDEGNAPTRVTKFDVLALVAEAISGIFQVLAETFVLARHMLETHASFVEEQKTFHEYAARTIETLQEGE